MPTRHIDNTLDELIEAHYRNIAALRSEVAAKYGSAIIGTGGVQPDEADAFRTAPFYGNPL